MRFATIVAGLSAVGLCACSQSSPASYEKGGPVTEVGHVSLSPPTSYSPIRGVICESYSIAKDGSATGECYDLSGPSVSLTEAYISLSAAQKLQRDIKAGRFDNPGRFKTGSDLVCDLETQSCWFERPENSKIAAPKHTQALFWGQGGQSPSGGPYKVIRGLVTGNDTQTFNLDFTAGDIASVELTSPSTFVFINIVPPDGKPFQASFVGAMEGDIWAETITQNGSYDVLVYQRGAAKDEGKTNRFTLTVNRKSDPH